MDTATLFLRALMHEVPQTVIFAILLRHLHVPVATIGVRGARHVRKPARLQEHENLLPQVVGGHVARLQWPGLADLVKPFPKGQTPADSLTFSVKS
jgi:hypothetical protein